MQAHGFIQDMLDVKVLILFVASRAQYPMELQKLYELTRDSILLRKKAAETKNLRPTALLSPCGSGRWQRSNGLTARRTEAASCAHRSCREKTETSPL